MASRHICPRCGGLTFVTTAHVQQDWEVDEYGNFLKCLSTNETVAEPDDDNLWTCASCGAEAVIASAGGVDPLFHMLIHEKTACLRADLEEGAFLCDDSGSIRVCTELSKQLGDDLFPVLTRIQTGKAKLSDYLFSSRLDIEKTEKYTYPDSLRWCKNRAKALWHPVKDYQNTKISYLTRSSENYKSFAEIVVPGLITPEQIQNILDTLQDQEYFVPELIDLPAERSFEFNDTDSIYWELSKQSFTPTVNKPTIKRSIPELIQDFEANKNNWQNENPFA